MQTSTRREPRSRPGKGQEVASKRTLLFVAIYCAVLMAVYNIAAIGLVSIPVTFILKDKLHLPPTAVSAFSIYTDGPFYVGFLFGFLRDRWRPMGRGDRGYILALPILMALVYAWMGFTTHSFSHLVVGILLISALSALLGAAAQGLLAAVAKDFGMTGRLAVVSVITYRAAMMYQSYIGGVLGEHAQPWVPFVLSGAVCLLVPLMALWWPRTIFRSGDEVFVNAVPEQAMDAVRRLIRHPAIYLPAACIFLFEFAPGWGTPLTYFLTNTKHLTEEQYGDTQTLLRFGQVVSILAYAFLCTRFRLKPLLVWGTFLAVIGGPAFLLIHSSSQAYAISLLAGLCCGIALGAYNDLLVRSCPKELEGVAWMLSASMFAIAGDVSDLFGSWLYEQGGFGRALMISTAFSALIWIPVALVPRAIADPPEGQRIVDEDPPLLAPEVA